MSYPDLLYFICVAVATVDRATASLIYYYYCSNNYVKYQVRIDCNNQVQLECEKDVEMRLCTT